MQRLGAFEVSQHAIARALADVLGRGVITEHADDPSALLPRVAVLAVAGPPADLLEDRAVEGLNEAREGTLGAVAHRVRPEPRERIGDRADDGTILLAGERVESAQERGEARATRTRERPRVVDEREPLLGRELLHTGVKEPVTGLVELPPIEPAAARIRIDPLGPIDAHVAARRREEQPMFAHAVRGPVPEDERRRPALR